MTMTTFSTSCENVSLRNRFSLKFIGLLLLFVMLSVSEGWGAVDDVVYKLNTASTKIAINSTYSNYGPVACASNVTSTISSASWKVTVGSMQAAGLWLGTNDAQKAKMILSNGSFTEASGIATAIEKTTSNTYIAALISETSLPNVGKVNLTYSTPAGTAPSSAWILYSTDNGSSWSVAATTNSLTSGVNFTFNTIASARYAFVIYCTGYCSFKVPILTFYEGATGNTVPTLSTPTSASITTTSATLGATISSNGGVSITESGIVYGTTASPTGNATPTNPLVSSNSAFTVNIGSLSPQTLYYYRGYATNGVGTGTGYSPDGNFRTLSNPPTGQASSFTATAGSSSLVANWNSATFPETGATNNGYILIYAPTGTTPTLSSSNGTAPVAGAGTLVNVTSGTTLTSTITGLTNGTLYNLLLIPYTFDGTAATYNYLTSGALTTTGTPVAVSYTWNGGTSGAWSSANNWTPNGVPAAGDAITFNTGGNVSVTSVPTVTLGGLTVSTSGTNVTLSPASTAASTITLSNSGTALSIASGTTLNLIGNTTNSRNITLAYSGSGNTATIAGTLNLQANGSGVGNYYATNSSTTVSGTLTSNSSSTVISSTISNLIFSSTGKFQLLGTATVIPTANWNSNSIVEIATSYTSSTSVTGLGQTFSNFTINSPLVGSSGIIDLGGNLTAISGSLTVLSTGSGKCYFNSKSSNITSTISGNYSQSGGIIDLGGSSGYATINIAGNFTQTGGTLYTYTSSNNGKIVFNGTTQSINSTGTGIAYVDFVINSGSNVNLLSDFQMTYSSSSSYPSTITVNSGGRLNCDNYIISNNTSGNAGKFVNNGTLGIGDVNGITSGTSLSGNIQVSYATNGRTFSTSGNYIYNGSAPQVTGTGLPTSITGNVTISNSAGVTLSRNTSFTGAGALTLSSGKLTTNGYTLTLANSTAGNTNSYIVADATGTVTMNAVTTAKTLPIGTSNSYAPLVITAGSSTAFTTYVVSSLPIEPTDASKTVGLAWSINGTNAPSSVVFQWNAANQGASFTSSGACELGRYTSPTYTVTNLSTAAGTDPNTITASSGFTSGSNVYVLGNAGAVWVDLPTITLTPASGVTVDAPFAITFTEDETWRNAITSVKVGGTVLDPSAYDKTVAGQITFTPSASTLLQSSGSKSIVISATGFSNSTVSQSIGVGAANKLAITTQPTAPANNGTTLSVQPIVSVVDRYGNATSSTAPIFAAVEAGSWSLSGTTSKSAVNGTATFTDLTATCTSAVNDATITFTADGLTSITSNAFSIPILVTAPSSPTSLTFGSVTYNSFTASFTAPGTAPTGYLVLRRSGSAVSGTPVAGTEYTLNQNNIGSGTNTVVYVGSSAWNAYSQSGLSDNTNYYYAVYSYNGSGATTNYSATSLTGNQITSVISAPTPSAATYISSTGFIANWEPVAGIVNYQLDVYTKTLSAAPELTVNGGFETGDLSNWSGSNIASMSILTSNPKSGTKYISRTGSNSARIEQVVDVEVGKSYIFSFWYNNYNATSDDGLKNYTIQGTSGTTYIEDGIPVKLPAASGWTKYEKVFTATTTSVKISIRAYQSLDIDDISLKINGDVEINNPVINSPFEVTETSKEVDNTTPNTTYYYRVRAVGVNSTSANSNVISVTTLESYNITASSNDEAKGSVSGGGAKDAGASVSLTATPANGSYRFVNWTENGSFVSKANPLEFTASVARNLVANFDDYSPAVSGEVNASTLADCPTCDLTVSAGAILTINESKTFNSVTVAPGAKLTLNNGHAFAPGTFVLESNSLGTATFVDKRSDANKTNIIATVQQHLPAATDRLWWYLASPVSDDASTVFGSNKVGEYSETTRSYSSPFSEPTALVAGKGYVVKMTATEATNYIFENKTLNTGNISVPLTRTVTQTADNAKRGFNLVGNPYPSYLNWNMAYNASTNVRPTIWYRTLVYDEGSASYKMDFHTYNASLNVAVPISVSGYIPPMQAFWVKVDKDPTSGSVSNVTLNMTNDMRSHAGVTANPLKAPAVERPLVRLVISNGSASDETVIVAHTAALDGYDSFDSEKMANDNINKPEIYSIAGTQELVISGVSPLSVDKQLALGVRPGKSGDYSISVGELKGIPADLKVVLKDKHTGAFTELTAGTAYSFNTDGNTVNDRFSLLFRAKDISTDIDNGKYLDLQVYGQNGQIVLRSAKLTGAEILVFNALGQPLYAQRSEGTTCTVRGNFTPGVYLVKVNNEVRKVTLK